jgi:hypothetical protein
MFRPLDGAGDQLREKSHIQQKSAEMAFNGMSFGTRRWCSSDFESVKRNADGQDELRTAADRSPAVAAAIRQNSAEKNIILEEKRMPNC